LDSANVLLTFFPEKQQSLTRFNRRGSAKIGKELQEVSLFFAYSFAPRKLDYLKEKKELVSVRNKNKDY